MSARRFVYKVLRREFVVIGEVSGGTVIDYVPGISYEVTEHGALRIHERFSSVAGRVYAPGMWVCVDIEDCPEETKEAVGGYQ